VIGWEELKKTNGGSLKLRLNDYRFKAPGGTVLLDYTYTYDPLGNITAKATEHGNYTYSYDSSSRLTSADHPVLPDEAYTYDNVGNRQTASGMSGTWNYNSNNELLGYADVEYTFDANGNLTRKKVGIAAVNYTYNAENRLVKVEDDLTKVVMAEYGYDPFGRRLWKDVQGVRTYFFYSEEGLVTEYDANGVEIRSYGYQPDSTWGTNPLWLKENGQYYFYQNDHLGTPQKLVAQNGAVVWSATYKAFGQAEIAPTATISNNLRFPGQYEDVETGLYYNYHRYYDPTIGRYPQADPIGLKGGSNLFAYSDNNPLMYRDILGLQPMVH
jgi:large repetitive protein